MLVGGEVAVLVMVEAVVRLLPGVLGNPQSRGAGLASPTGCSKAPPTRVPRRWRGLAVPEVLRSGNHAAIARWRRDRALERTAARRPDLLAALPPDALDAADRAFLAGGAEPRRRRTAWHRGDAAAASGIMVAQLAPVGRPEHARCS